MYTQLQGKFRTVKAVCASMLCLDHIYYLSSNNPSFFWFVLALKKHNPHTGGTNYQHPLHSTPFKNKSPVMIYILSQLKQPDLYTNHWQQCLNKRSMETLIPSGSPPLPAFWFPLVKPFGHKQAAGIYREGVFRCSVTCKHCPPVLSGHKLIGQQQKCLKGAEPFYFCAWHSALSPVKSTVVKPWERMCPQLLTKQSQHGRKAGDVLCNIFQNASVLVKLTVAEPYLLFALIEKSALIFSF